MLSLRKLRVPAYALLIATAVLFFCSKSSPGYPINDWVDANIYFTVGKGITQGQLVYRDMYDHKGPLIYMMHALCALVSFSDFTGVWLMEIALATAFLLGVYRLFTIYGAPRAALVALPVVALLIYSSYSFQQGDSAEELCLPMVIWPMCWLLEHFRSGEGPMPTRRVILSGVLFGCVFWIKFTLVGLFAGLALAMVLRPACRRQWREMGRLIGLFALGFVLATLPWVIYFALNGALRDWLRVYLYDNIFLYAPAGSEGGMRNAIRLMIECGVDWLVGNLRYSLLVLLGLVLSLRRPVWERVAIWLMTLTTALGVFVGGKSFPYYGLAMAAVCPLGLALVLPWLEKHWPTRKGVGTALAAVACAVCVGLCPLVSYSMTTDEGAPFGQPREETMQYKLAAYMEPGASLLNYGSMDAGFYTASGLVPQVKYFHKNNMSLSEMLWEQDRYVHEGVCDYVVTHIQGSELIDENYELIASAKSPNFWYDEMFLYRRKTN